MKWSSFENRTLTQRKVAKHPERRENMLVGEMKTFGELTAKGDESAPHLKTPTDSVKPAFTLQELQGSQTGNCWV